MLPAAVSVKSPLCNTFRQVFEVDGAALFLAHSHACLHVWTSHTQGHTQNYVIRQNSTITTFHYETEACSESPDPSSSLPFALPTNRPQRVWATQDQDMKCH